MVWEGEFFFSSKDRPVFSNDGGDFGAIWVVFLYKGNSFGLWLDSIGGRFHIAEDPGGGILLPQSDWTFLVGVWYMLWDCPLFCSLRHIVR